MHLAKCAIWHVPVMLTYKNSKIYMLAFLFVLPSTCWDLFRGRHVLVYMSTFFFTHMRCQHVWRTFRHAVYTLDMHFIDLPCCISNPTRMRGRHSVHIPWCKTLQRACWHTTYMSTSTTSTLVLAHVTQVPHVVFFFKANILFGVATCLRLGLTL